MVLPLYVALLAHLLADFVLQTDRMCLHKSISPRQGLLKHAGLVAGVNFLLLAYFGPGLAAIFVLLVTAAHLLIDMGKCRLQQGDNNILLFVVDQAFHLGVIVFGWYLLYFQKPLRQIPERLAVLWVNLHLPSPGEIMLYLIVILLAVFVGDVFIKLVLQKINGQADTAVTSRYIGIVERLLVMLMVVIGEVGAIGFIFAAKSVARFQKLDEKFASYYLLGTLLSLLWAILAGLALLLLAG